MRRLTLLIAIATLFVACSHDYESDVLDLTNYQWNIWLDKDAEWENDSLYLPPVDIATLPVNKPTIGWDALHRGKGKLVRIPATVEEHFWGENGHAFGISGNYAGVSWFTTRFTLPELWEGKRIVIRFESVRLRAEVYLNGELVGYDLINGTPFEIDVTEKINYVLDNNLAVRITDPNGNFAWRDCETYQWGNIGISPSHGFGGITGGVSVQVTDSVFVSDLFIKNRDDISSLDLEVTMNNLYESHSPGELKYTITDLSNGEIVFSQTDHQEIFLKEETIYTTLSVPDARYWSPNTPALYELKIDWAGENGSASSIQDQFGFRWFDVREVDGDRQFYLNDKRIVLRSAISWGHWPVNGIFPSPELAEKQVRTAKALGLNMLNFHRGIGQAIVLEEADKQGLLYYQEPGGYRPGQSDFNMTFKREKLLRMVKRDRNHPSLVIDSIYTFGLWDEHHAGGPGVYLDRFYNGPDDIHRHYDKSSELVFLGEDGAIGTPPRLELINKQIATTVEKGWDGDQYQDQFEAFDRFLDEKGFRKAFPSVDDLTTSFGAVAHYYHGRIIENFRIGNSGDGYVVNGWEDTKIENHSGIVDAFRNSKADPLIMAYYNQPLYVAVKLRNKVMPLGDTIISDFFIINEENLQGDYFLRITTKDEFSTLDEQGFNLQVTGGHIYGELLQEGVSFKPVNPGYYTVVAQLYDGDRLMAEGEEKAYIVSYAPEEFKVPIAVFDTSGEMQEVLSKSGIENIVSYKTFDYPNEKVMVLGGAIQPSVVTGTSRMYDPMIDWVMRGNTLIITKNADLWADYLDEKEVVDYRGKRIMDRYWFGGNYFVREHALFEGLPVNRAFNWEYQNLAGYENRNRFGMRLKGEECVVGCYADHNREVYTSVGIIPVGEGQIILSSLDIAAAIKEDVKSAVVAKLILMNYLKYGLDVDDYIEAEDAAVE